jgi:hypothetical protein
MSVARILVLAVLAGSSCHGAGKPNAGTGDSGSPRLDGSSVSPDLGALDVGRSGPDAPPRDSAADALAADATVPACPREAPVATKTPFTPVACTVADNGAHLVCPFEIAAGPLRGCHAAFQCVCVSSQMLGVPPTCTWGPDMGGYQCPDAGMPDVGPLRCGSATCAPDQYCVSRAGGPAPRCFPHPEAGGCPPGTREGCSFPVFQRGCEEVRQPSFQCESIATSCAAQEPCRCLCSLNPGPTGGCFVNGRSLTCSYP